MKLMGLESEVYASTVTVEPQEKILQAQKYISGVPRPTFIALGAIVCSVMTAQKAGGWRWQWEVVRLDIKTSISIKKYFRV